MNVASAVVLSILLLAAAAPAAFAVTLSGNQDEYNPGDQLIVTGTAGPNEDITFKVSNPNGAQVAVGQTAADAEGDFTHEVLRFPSAATTTWPFGSYTVTATAGSGSVDLAVTFAETAAVAPSQPAASQESGGFAVTVSADGTYQSGDSVSIFVLTTDNGVLTTATISVARVQAPSGSENVLSTCTPVSTGLQRCSYSVAGGVGTYAVLVSAFTGAGSSSAVGTFQVSSGINIDIPEAESNAPILNAIAGISRDIDALGNDVADVEGAVGGINIPTPPAAVIAPVVDDVESVVALASIAPVIVAAALTFKFPVVVATLTTKSVLASPTNALPSPLKLAAVTIPVVLVLPAASMVIAVPT